jgi:hypothetical protein
MNKDKTPIEALKWDTEYTILNKKSDLAVMEEMEKTHPDEDFKTTKLKPAMKQLTGEIANLENKLEKI